MDQKKKKRTAQNPHTITNNSTPNQNNLCLPFPQVLLEHHAQFYSVNTNIGDPIENAKEQKPSKVQAVDAPPLSPARQRLLRAPPRHIPTHYLQQNYLHSFLSCSMSPTNLNFLQHFPPCCFVFPDSTTGWERRGEL